MTIADPANAPLLDVLASADIFSCGIGRVEHIGFGCVRLYFFAPESSAEPPGRVVVAKAVVPACTLASMALTLTANARGRPVEVEADQPARAAMN